MSQQLQGKLNLNANNEAAGNDSPRQEELMQELDKILTEMDMVQASEYNDLTGNPFIWRAKQLVATVERE